VDGLLIWNNRKENKIYLNLNSTFFNFFNNHFWKLNAISLSPQIFPQYFYAVIDFPLFSSAIFYEQELWKIIRRMTIYIVLGDYLILRTSTKRLKANALFQIVNWHRSISSVTVVFLPASFSLGFVSFDPSRTDTRPALKRQSGRESILWSIAVLCRRNVCHTSSKITKKEMRRAESGVEFNWTELRFKPSSETWHDKSKKKKSE